MGGHRVCPDRAIKPKHMAAQNVELMAENQDLQFKPAVRLEPTAYIAAIHSLIATIVGSHAPIPFSLSIRRGCGFGTVRTSRRQRARSI